jgi:hypothetical protein
MLKHRVTALKPIVGALFFVGLISTALSDERDSTPLRQTKTPFSLQERLVPATASEKFEVPEGMTLVITDIVIQNHSGGGGPVADSVFSVIFFGTILNNKPVFGERREEDVQVTAIGNQVFKVNFSTGLEAWPYFRVHNAINSNAEFASIIVSGYLIQDDRKDDHKGPK